MTDWRGVLNKSFERRGQLTGNGTNVGIFPAYIDTATGETQSGKFVYAGGERSIPLPMPFESNTSWIRAIPESATPALASYRADTGDVVCLNYTSTSHKSKLEAYTAGLNAYRILQPGEIEINSAGMAQSYYGARPNLEHRGGLVRSWLDQDRLESGAKAPIHSRQLWQHASNSIGDEERFGVVRRPYNFLFDPTTFIPRNALSAILALSINSYNYHDYPFPDFSLPGGVPAVFGLASAAASTATAALLTSIGEFKLRPFAKEYLKVIKNPLFGISLSPNSKLIDFREGQVFDDFGFQTIGPNGAYLRAKYEYYTPTLDATTFTIDEIGNVNWRLSVGAIRGWDVLIPTGPFSLTALQNISLTSALNIDTLSAFNTGITAGFSASITSGLDTSILAGFGCDTKVLTGDKTTLVTVGNMDTKVALNTDYLTGVNYTVKAGAKMTLFSPLIDIGAVPSTAMVLGNELSTFMLEFISAWTDAASFITTGNLGAPTPINPIILARLLALKAIVASPPSNIWLSKTIKVSI